MSSTGAESLLNLWSVSKITANNNITVSSNHNMVHYVMSPSYTFRGGHFQAHVNSVMCFKWFYLGVGVWCSSYIYIPIDVFSEDRLGYAVVTSHKAQWLKEQKFFLTYATGSLLFGWSSLLCGIVTATPS